MDGERNPLAREAVEPYDGGQEVTEEVEGVKLVVIGSTIGFFLFGYDTGIVSGAADWAQDSLDMTDLEQGIMVGATGIAAAVTCLFTSWCNTHLGRRTTICVSSIFYIIGAGGIAGAVDFWSITAFRVALGIAIGFATTTVPLYLAECVPPDIRGQIITLSDLCIAFGQVSAGLVNVACKYWDKNWRFSMGLAALPAVVQLILFVFFLEESPRWLAQNRRMGEAKRVFTKYRGTSKTSTAELRQLTQYADDLQQESFLGAWRQPHYARAMIVGIVLMILNQASGINTVMYFSHSILKNAGFSEEMSIWGALICDITQAVGVCVSLYFMEKRGRRYLAILSACLVVPTIALLGVGYMRDIRELSVSAMAVYLFCFGLGLSGVPWTMNGEIFPLAIRNTAQSQSIFTNWFLNGIIAVAFPVFMDDYGEYFFFLFSFVAFCGAIWMFLFLPDTTGLSLEQMDTIFATPLRVAVRTRKWLLVTDLDDLDAKHLTTATS